MAAARRGFVVVLVETGGGAGGRVVVGAVFGHFDVVARGGGCGVYSVFLVSVLGLSVIRGGCHGGAVWEVGL